MTQQLIDPQMLIDENLCQHIRHTEEPQEILFQLFKRFKDRAAIVTSGQVTGMVLIHLADANKLPFRVCTIDTRRLFPETYKFFERVETRYQRPIERIQPDANQVERMVSHHGEHLFFDSKTKQEYCCDIRKVRPMQRLLDSLDVWFSGLRRDQSESRRDVPKAEIIDHNGRPVLKVNPLVDWTEEQVWDFIGQNDVPVNPLLKPDRFEHYYESLGCVICTSRIRPGESRRAGRWRWQNTEATENNKECGLHYAI